MTEKNYKDVWAWACSETKLKADALRKQADDLQGRASMLRKIADDLDAIRDQEF